MEEKSFNQVEFEDYIKNDKGKSLSSFIIDKIDNQHQELNHITKFKDITIDFKGITHEVLLDFYNIECEIISISNYDISDKNPKKLPNIYFKNIKAKEIHVNQCKFNSLQFIEDESNFIVFRINGSSITEVNMKSNLNGQLIIQGSNFVNINLSNHETTTINGGLIFNFCNIDGRVAFKDFIFKGKVLFNFTTFRDNIYFNNSIFKDYTSFYHCECEKTASFYGAVFEKSPNFFQSIFRESINAVNTNLKFNFEDLQTTINQEYKTYKEDTNLQQIAILINHKNKSLDNFANDFRDSFRMLKNTLIKDNNLLDASNFHKYELYSKEIELDSKENKTIKDKVEKWQLWFYRKLCDHHTDILQSFHSLMLVIGLFGLVSFGVIAGFDYCLGYKPILSHLYMIKEIYDAHIQSFIKTHTLYTFACDFLISGAYLLMLFISINWKIPRVFLIGVSYFIVICILFVSPKILIPAMGIFTDKRALLDPLSTLGGIYTIIFGFVLFSFIKTIRKNSIVPN